jgi:hypothetical protein
MALATGRLDVVHETTGSILELSLYPDGILAELVFNRGTTVIDSTYDLRGSFKAIGERSNRL